MTEYYARYLLDAMSQHYRVKIDQAQERIFGPDYMRWHERYAYWDEHDTY